MDVKLVIIFSINLNHEMTINGQNHIKIYIFHILYFWKYMKKIEGKKWVMFTIESPYCDI